MNYQHVFVDGSKSSFSPGKVVCVGRNYAEHARELNNPVPDSPLLFIKPSTSLADMSQPIVLPPRGECHHELELALLIGRPLRQSSAKEALSAVSGYGLALDLTLRAMQAELKKKGHPWERAKAFDGACPLSAFVASGEVNDWRSLELKLWRNGQLQQHGHCADMLFAVDDLLAEISHSFTLLPGDVVLTGTPAGVGPLCSSDVLKAELLNLLAIETRVA